MNSTSFRDAGRGSFRPATAASLALLLLAAACGRDETTAPFVPVEGTITVDATAGWAYLSLQDEAVVVPANPATSTAWDIAFNGTNVMLNGGQAGSGSVTGYCLCQNSATSPDNATILAYTAEGELADYAAVSASTVPAASSFVSDNLVPALAGWYTGSGASAAAASGKAWLVRLNGGSAYAKLRVVSLEGPSVGTPGTVTLEYAVQPSADAPLGATRTIEVAVPASGSVSVDLLNGATTTSATDWDLEFEGWTLRVNGGASGSGSTAVYLTDEPFAQITTAATISQAYQTDTFGGVFKTHPWYRYNLTGTHDITPVFDVYLIRSGDQVYKIQLTDYYDATGKARHITVRYTLLAD